MIGHIIGAVPAELNIGLIRYGARRGFLTVVAVGGPVHTDLDNLRDVKVTYFGDLGQLPFRVALLFAAIGGALHIATVGVTRLTQLRLNARRRRHAECPPPKRAGPLTGERSTDLALVASGTPTEIAAGQPGAPRDVFRMPGRVPGRRRVRHRLRAANRSDPLPASSR